MTAATAYYLRLVAYRQSVLPPVLLFVAIVAMVYASDAGAPVPAATVTSVAVMPICAWVARAVATAESPPFAEITAVALGGVGRRLLARAGAAALVGAGLSAVATVWAAVVNPQPYPAGTLAVIAGMHLAEVIAGVGVGCLLAPPMPVAGGTAAVALTGLVLVSLLVPWLPPLGPLLHHLDRLPTPGPVTIALVVAQAAVFGGLCAGVAGLLDRRRSVSR